MTRIGIAQMEPHIGELEHNLKHLRDIFRMADEQEVEILVLPELANSGYVFESKKEAERCAEEIPTGEFSRSLRSWSEKGRLVVGGINERYGEVLFNSAGIFGNGEFLGVYRKVHLFNEEKLWFTPGPAEPPVFNFNGNRFGIMICWDWAFPELARILALKGAQIILHPANLVLDYCQMAMKTRALENGVFTATANRIGIERNLTFTGKSQITNSKGSVLITMPDGEIGVQHADIDLTLADEKNLTDRNHLLRDRRPEIYELLTEDS